jgi:hypothetical protein
MASPRQHLKPFSCQKLRLAHIKDKTRISAFNHRLKIYEKKEMAPWSQEQRRAASSS